MFAWCSSMLARIAAVSTAPPNRFAPTHHPTKLAFAASTTTAVAPLTRKTACISAPFTRSSAGRSPCAFSSLSAGTAAAGIVCEALWNTPGSFPVSE